MKREDLDARFPDRPAPRVEPTGTDRHFRVDLALSYLARRAVDLPAREPENVVRLAQDILQNPWAFWRPSGKLPTSAEQQDGIGIAALFATRAEDWDLVVRCTGLRPLGSRVHAKRDYDGNLTALVRHLATAVRARLPATSVVVAMTRLRERFHANELVDPRIAIIATRIFVELAGEADPVDACLRWLAGESLELDARARPAAVADGDDPRVAIFERFAPELGNDAGLDAEVRRTLAETDERESYLRSTLIPRRDEAVIPAYLARRPLPAGWEALVDPLVAHWLGGDVGPDQLEAGRARLERTHHYRAKIQSNLTRAIDALVLRNTAVIQHLFPVPSRKPFVPGVFFKDDAEKLLAYLGAAHDAGATTRDVEPAWWDFLARRTPKTAKAMRPGHLTWRHLLGLAMVIHRLGGGDPKTSGRELQRTLTGV
jgi:hypothetical protein